MSDSPPTLSALANIFIQLLRLQLHTGLAVNGFCTNLQHLVTVAAVGQRNGTHPASVNAITNPTHLDAFEDHQLVNDCTELHYTISNEKMSA